MGCCHSASPCDCAAIDQSSMTAKWLNLLGLPTLNYKCADYAARSPGMPSSVAVCYDWSLELFCVKPPKTCLATTDCEPAGTDYTKIDEITQRFCPVVAPPVPRQKHSLIQF